MYNYIYMYICMCVYIYIYIYTNCFGLGSGVPVPSATPLWQRAERTRPRCLARMLTLETAYTCNYTMWYCNVYD